MTENELMELAKLIRDGKASDEQRLQFVRALNLELGEVSKSLKEKE